LWRAVRVTAARGGALRSEGLEAPFVGRERELRLVKELFHASAEQSRAQLVQVTGIAGIGKSRLSWEYFKYLDGLAETIWWHRGRCLAYGEGVATGRWSRWCGCVPRSSRASLRLAREKLAARPEHIPARGRAGRPRLANPLGLEERVTPTAGSVRRVARCFGRLGPGPLVMVFEICSGGRGASRVKWVPCSSGHHRASGSCVARPDDRAAPRPRPLDSQRYTLALEPLSDAEMTQLLDGYVLVAGRAERAGRARRACRSTRLRRMPGSRLPSAMWCTG
jgi:hypothetical protein